MNVYEAVFGCDHEVVETGDGWGRCRLCGDDTFWMGDDPERLPRWATWYRRRPDIRGTGARPFADPDVALYRGEGAHDA